VRRQVSIFTFPPPPVRLLVQGVTYGFAPTRLSSDYLTTQSLNANWTSVLERQIRLMTNSRKSQYSEDVSEAVTIRYIDALRRAGVRSALADSTSQLYNLSLTCQA